MKVLHTIAVLSLASLVVVGCGGGGSSGLRGKACKPSENLVPLDDVPGAKPIAFDRMESASAPGLAAGTYTYWRSQVFIVENRIPNPANVGDIFGLSAAHLKNAQGTWAFQNACFTGTPADTAAQQFLVAGKFVVSAGASGVATTQTSDFMNANVSFTPATGIVSTMGAAQAPTNNALDKIYLLNGGNQRMLKMDAPSDDVGHYQVRTEYTLNNRRYALLVIYKFWPEGTDVPADQIFTPQAPSTP